MTTTMTNEAEIRHLSRLENLRPAPAKVLTNRETPNYRALVGECVGRAIAIANLTIKEAAALLGIDPAQLSRWISGAERVQADRILACPKLHGPFVIAYASGAEGIDVSTVITLRRTA